MITIASIREISPNYDLVYGIVRSLKNKPDYVTQVPELAPSSGLYSWYLKTKDEGNWNESTFNSIYVPRFINELTQESKSKLKEIGGLDKQGKNILLFCFCPNEKLCHRSIIAGILQGMKCNVNISIDYSYYYDMFLKVHGKHKNIKLEILELDEEPDCGKCKHVNDSYTICNKCGPEYGWQYYYSQYFI